MNTVGKILVVLNLLFALATGAFLVMDAATRIPWRQEAESAKKIGTTLHATNQALTNTNKNLLAENKKLQEQLDNLMIASKGQAGQDQITLQEALVQLKKQEEIANNLKLANEKAIAEGKRLQGEVALLAAAVKTREKELLAMQADLNKTRGEFLQAREVATTATLRAQNLQKQVLEMQLAMAKMQQGPAQVTKVSPRDPNYSNPPPAYVKGKILKIDPKQRELVQISIGSDAGLKDDQTLEVYRLSPSPAYLGRLRIVETFPHTALGRLMRPTGVAAVPLREDDEVASTIR